MRRSPKGSSRSRNYMIDTVNNELLVTAQIHILDNKQQPVDCRTLIDTGATTNFITEDLAKRLDIPKKECSIPVGALNSMTTIAKHTVTATIQSRINDYQRTLTFLTIPKIADLVPDQPVNTQSLKIPKNIKLADPTFHRPGPIHVLLGSGAALSLLSIGQINLSPPNGPDLYLQKTRFGWVIGGSPSTTSQGRCLTYHSNKTLQSSLTRFWEIEEGPQVQILSKTDEYCESHFTQHITGRADGRYVLALPFNDKVTQLGESRSRALKRLELCSLVLMRSY
ncbi:uncharacterized protein LOC143264103 [Megachile rotundata]|uniref:uncharacterized protein LOC143264103 n=1 Tax=Megachile rotundata TaxID=143995 RepID=UPI003FD6A4F8